MLDIKQVQEEAEKEVRGELYAEAKEKLKVKQRSIKTAQKVVANLVREYDDLLSQLGESS